MKTESIIYRVYAVMLAVLGLVAFFFLIGDEVPDCPLTWGEFALVKCGSLAVLALVGVAAQALYRKVYGGDGR